MLVFPVKAMPGMSAEQAVKECMQYCNKHKVALDLLWVSIVQRIIPGPVTPARIDNYLDSMNKEAEQLLARANKN